MSDEYVVIDVLPNTVAKKGGPRSGRYAVLMATVETAARGKWVVFPILGGANYKSAIANLRAAFKYAKLRVSIRRDDVNGCAYIRRMEQ